MCSPVRGIKSGSIKTSGQTSVRRLACSLILISLRHIDGKPPFGQDGSDLIVNFAPHPHVEGEFRGCQLYLRARASRKAEKLSCAG